MEKILFSLSSLPKRKEGLTLALGNFDGFHLGHQALAKKAVEEAEGDSGILFFAKPFLDGVVLSDLEDKIRFSYGTGLDCAYCLQNDPSFYSLPKGAFLDLLEELGTRKVVCGPDFRFGKGALGDVNDLKERFETVVVPFLCDEKGEKISSHVIKELIREGEMEKASSLLGRPYETKGEVVHGLENGRRIGFPTLNLEPEADYALPRKGVYVGLVYLSGIPHKAMINVGINPTVGELREPLEEAHLFDYEGDAYGKRAYFQYLSYLREEKRFASLEELSAQLKEDKEEALSYFSK